MSKPNRRTRRAKAAVERRTRKARPRKPLDLSKPFMDTPQLGELLGVDKRSCERWRAEGSGPPYIKLKGVVLYDVATVLAWIRSHERTSTSTSAP